MPAKIFSCRGHYTALGIAPPGGLDYSVRMFRPLANLLYRRRDPSRFWLEDSSKLIVDIARCSVCQVHVGGFIEDLCPLGPSEDAQRAAKGYLEWYSKGVSCIVEDGKVGDFTINISPTLPRTAAFPGQFHHNGQ